MSRKSGNRFSDKDMRKAQIVVHDGAGRLCNRESGVMMRESRYDNVGMR